MSNDLFLTWANENNDFYDGVRPVEFWFNLTGHGNVYHCIGVTLDEWILIPEDWRPDPENDTAGTLEWKYHRPPDPTGL